MPHGLTPATVTNSGQPKYKKNTMKTTNTKSNTGKSTNSKAIAERLEYLRGEIRQERISYGELAELQSLSAHIPATDTELLEAAGVPEDLTQGREGAKAQRVGLNIKFKPNRRIDGPNSPSNGERADKAEESIQAHFGAEARDGIDYTQAQDLVSDLLHLCDREGWDADALIQSAKNRWEEER